MIVDKRTGEVHDYRRKGGIEFAEIVMPPGVAAMSRSDLWNGVELHHKRGDATVAREFEAALPAELSLAERRRLAVDFTREVCVHYSVAADVDGHHPNKDGDERNHHVHILFTACTISVSGFGKKAAELDPIHCQRHKIANPAELWRERWAELVNERLRENGISARVDHRSLEAQGIEREPTVHLGPVVSEMERRGQETIVKKRIAGQIAERVRQVREVAAKLVETAKQIKAITAQIMQDKMAALQSEGLALQGAAGGQITEVNVQKKIGSEKKINQLKDELASLAKKQEEPRRPRFMDYAKSVQDEKSKEQKPVPPQRDYGNDYDVEI